MWMNPHYDICDFKKYVDWASPMHFKRKIFE